MDVREIDEFFDYQLTFDEEPTHLVEEIVSQASKYLPPEQIPAERSKSVV